MNALLQKAADSRSASCPETKSWPLGHAIWLFVLCLALWAAGPRAVAQTPVGLDLQLYAGLTLTGTVGSVYSIEYVTDLSQTNNASAWRCLEFLQLPTSPYLWTDKSAPAAAKRFYRGVALEPPANMVFIPPGTFRMGSPENEVDRGAEGPQTAVTISRGFWIGKYEVTQGDYLAVMGSNPSEFTTNYGYAEDLARPVEQVSWNDAVAYCAQLTERERLAGRIGTNGVYRLPTEAEWEYACRGWTSTRFSYGDDPGYTNLTYYAWYEGNSAQTTHPVGQKLPNPWGLYDMHGNVWEWCQDWWSQSLPGGSVVDPTGPDSADPEWLDPSYRVIRGGSYMRFDFYDDPGECRSAARILRSSEDTAYGSGSFGFRVVLAPGQQ